MKNIFSRLEKLEKIYKEREEKAKVERAKHEPFIEFEPWSFLNDEFIVKYFPDGLYKKPEILDRVSYELSRGWLLQQPPQLYCQIHMGSCTEWLFVFHQIGKHAERYTAEQRERFKQMDMKESPELVLLYQSEIGKQLMGLMQKLPQCYGLRLGDYQKILRE